MKNLYISLFLFLGIYINVAAQEDTVSLRECLKAAQENAVLYPQYDVLNDIAELKIANAKATSLPSLAAYGKAWYQSDAVTVALPNGGFEIDPFQYNAGVEASQKIFDGGIAGKASRLEKASLEAEYGKIETELYQLNTQVTDLFFQALLLSKKSTILNLRQEIIQKRIQEMQSAVENGILKRNDLEKMQAEFLIAQQQSLEIDQVYQQIGFSIRVLTGIEISERAQYIVNDSLFMLNEKNRPEHLYFDAEIQKLESLATLQQSKNSPKLFAYGQAGYSYPGLNFFENQSDYYYIVGAKLSWTLFDWKQNKREVSIIQKQKESIAVKKSDFDQKLSIAKEKELIAHKYLKNMIAMDHKIIQQRAAVTKGSEIALENGAITSSDYLEDLNTEIKARLDFESHKIELQRSIILLKLLEGIDLASL